MTEQYDDAHLLTVGVESPGVSFGSPTCAQELSSGCVRDDISEQFVECAESCLCVHSIASRSYVQVHPVEDIYVRYYCDLKHIPTAWVEYESVVPNCLICST